MIRRALLVAALLLLSAAGPAAAGPAGEAGPARAATPEEVAWFQATEHELLGSIARGDRTPWERVTDGSFVFTSEDGEVLGRQQLLDELRPLPAGLSGGIEVRELTVQAFTSFAIVRFLADEHQTVFGQGLTTRYRVTNAYRRAGKAWKLAASHLSVVPADPPEQPVSRAAWPGLVGEYRLLPDGWTFTVELREGKLHGGRDPRALRPMIPLAANVFVVSGRPGEWIFVADESGRATRLVNFRKFTPLVWTRVEPGPAR